MQPELAGGEIHRPAVAVEGKDDGRPVGAGRQMHQGPPGGAVNVPFQVGQGRGVRHSGQQRVEHQQRQAR